MEGNRDPIGKWAGMKGVEVSERFQWGEVGEEMLDHEAVEQCGAIWGVERCLGGVVWFVGDS